MNRLQVVCKTVGTKSVNGFYFGGLVRDVTWNTHFDQVFHEWGLLLVFADDDHDTCGAINL